MSSNGSFSPRNVKAGDVLPEYPVTVPYDVYSEYNRATGEINPLHFDRPYAQSLGYRNIVVAGLYTYAFVPRMLDEWLGNAGSIRNLRVDYRNPVYIDETFLLRPTVVRTRSEGDCVWIDLDIPAVDGQGGELFWAAVTVVCL